MQDWEWLNDHRGASKLIIHNRTESLTLKNSSFRLLSKYLLDLSCAGVRIAAAVD